MLDLRQIGPRCVESRPFIGCISHRSLVNPLRHPASTSVERYHPEKPAGEERDPADWGHHPHHAWRTQCKAIKASAKQCQSG